MKKTLTAAAVIFIISFAAYSNAFSASFHFDDIHQIVKNHNIRSLGSIPRFFVSARMGSYRSDLVGYRPVTYASFALNYALTGYRVWGYHLLNVLLHALNGFMVYLVAGRVLERAGRPAAYASAIGAAALFAAHPVAAGAVTYISGRAALLASAFCLAAFYAFLRFGEGGRGGAWWGVASAAFFLLGLLSKEMAVCFIGLAFLYDALFTFGGEKGDLRRVSYHIAPLAVLAAFLITRRALGGFFTVEDAGHTIIEYLRSESAALLLYLRILVLPFNLNADYDLPVSAASDPRVWAGAALVMAAVYAVFRYRKARPEAAFFIGWFLLALAPESSFFPVTDIAVEYRVYLASAGLFALAAMSAARLVQGRPPMKVVAAILVGMLIVLTFARNRVWADEHSLWSDVAHKSPGSARAHANLGNAFVHDGRYGEAVGELERSLDMNPFYDQSYNVFNNLGICFFRLGSAGEAIEQFRRAIKVFPGYVEGYANLGAALYEMGDYAQARDALEEAVLLDPAYAQAHNNLAGVYQRLGMREDASRERDIALRLGGTGGVGVEIR